MSHRVLLLLHLLAAIAFAGVVFFETLMLDAMRRRVSDEALHAVESALGARAAQVMPWVLLVLFAAGTGLAWHHRGALRAPLDSGFATLLALKIALAIGVAGHVVAAMRWRRRGVLHAARSRRLHRRVFVLVLAIVVLAKVMAWAPG